ncbi:MAG: hypothetical protein GC160_19775 [Acidobacteria bacterium]|nr:hypothetical protein [Acidobacteriota bacterium]
MPTSTDRLSQLRSRQQDFTGIEFVQVVSKCDQKVLRLYFLTDTLALRPPFEDVGDASVIPAPLTPGDIRIYSPRGEAPDVLLEPDPALMQWGEDAVAQRRYLEIVVQERGTFTEYRLFVDDALGRIDRVYNDVAFSFKVGCDDDLDCAEPQPACEPADLVDFPVDYLARDFVSLRNALLDFAAQRYPNWQAPKEADVGVMFLEILAALGDELSYVQDRFHREAYLETATERRSLRKKARLMDYEIHDGRMASTTLELTVAPGTISVEGGSTVWAPIEGSDPLAFEIGNGLKDRGVNFAVDARWNPGNFTPYAFDDDEACLQPGATSLYVRNDPAGPENPGGVVFDLAAAALWSEGRLLLLRDLAADASEVERLRLVRVVSVELVRDELFDVDLALIRWDERDALPFHLPLAELSLSGNLAPVTAGESRTVSFRLGPLQPGDADDVLSAVEREGPLYAEADAGLLSRRDPCDDGEAEAAERRPIYLLSLPDTDADGLAFADLNDDLRATVPEMIVYPDGEEDDPWDFQRTLLLSDPEAQVYTLEDGMWRRIVGYWRDGEEYVHRDYATGAGYTVRFGDGEFGRLPPRDSLFHVEYRLGSGTRANLAAGAVNATSIPHQTPPLIGPLEGLVTAVSNPFPITSGVDPETPTQIKLLTPEAYQAKTLFAVRPEDYGAQAETLDFVQRAQGSFRWTGSWLSATTAVDPAGSFQLSESQRDQVENLLCCRRQAGREVIVADPKYVNLDLRVNVCTERSAFAGQVKTRVLNALFGPTGRPGVQPFFDPDRFTFGTPLRRAALEAAILAVDGVEAVTGMEIRVHGVTDFVDFDSLTFEVADDELIRLENTRLAPERGSLRLSMEGGA